MFYSLFVPLNRLAVVLRNTLAFQIAPPKVVLGLSMSLLRGLSKPLDRFCMILGYPMA